MANNQIHPRVLVIDDEERVREDLHDMFEPLGYDVKVVTGSNIILLDNAKSLARQFRPHVAIVDLRLLLNDDPTDRSGFKLLKELGPTRCILYSAYINPETSRQLADLKTAGWIGKEEPPQMLVDMVNKITRESSAAQKNFKIEKNSISFEQISHTLLGRNATIPPFMVEDILCQMFHDTPGINIETISGAVKTPTSVNRGRSAILKVKRKDKIEPFVVKVAVEEDISKEYQNYKKYIDGNLGGSFNAILKGEPQIFWDMGAVIYNFLGSPNQNMSEFSAFYQKEQNSDIILKPLQTFFSEVWHGLYDEKKEIATPLYLSYEKNLGLQKRLISFPDQTEYRTFQGVSAKLLNPVTWVLKHKMDSAILDSRQAVTHGDLHGDNIFVDGTHAWVIDFERSGWGHVLRDFTELEVDILTRLSWKKDDKDPKEFFFLLTCLSDPYSFEKVPNPVDQLKNNELRKAFNVIKGLRSLAKEVTKFNDFREYIWSLLFDFVFVATHTEEEEHQHERALLYGSVLCSRLQYWGKEWPPEEWKAVLTDTHESIAVVSQNTSQGNDTAQKPSEQVPVQKDVKELHPRVTNILLAGAFLVLFAVVVAALGWVMIRFGITLPIIVAIFIILAIFAVIVFPLLGLAKGADLINAITKMLSTLMRSPDKESPQPGETNNDKLEG